MERGISFEVIDVDEGLVEVRVRAGNGRFAAVAECFGEDDMFSRIREAVDGFPASPEDHRELVVGTFDPGYLGGAKLTLRCVDLVGHAVADVVVQTDATGIQGCCETASFSFPVESTGIDAFVKELRRAPMAVGDVASLRQVS